MAVRALPTGSVTARNRQPPESNVVQDHIGLGHHRLVYELVRKKELASVRYGKLVRIPKTALRGKL